MMQPATASAALVPGGLADYGRVLCLARGARLQPPAAWDAEHWPHRGLSLLTMSTQLVAGGAVVASRAKRRRQRWRGSFVVKLQAGPPVAEAAAARVAPAAPAARAAPASRVEPAASPANAAEAAPPRASPAASVAAAEGLRWPLPPALDDGRSRADVEASSAAATVVRIENRLCSPLVLDGLWLKSGSLAASPALSDTGVPASDVAELRIRGEDVSALLWLRASSWPFAVVSLGLTTREGSLSAAAEWGRVLRADARQLLEAARPLPENGMPASMGLDEGPNGVLLRQAAGPSGPIEVVVLPQHPATLAPRSVFDALPEFMRPQPAFPWPVPNLEVMASWMFPGADEPRGLMGRLERSCAQEGGAGFSPAKLEQPVADLRLFTLLGVEPGATPRQVRKAWRKRAQQLHPDLGSDASDFDEVREAYRVLADPVLRARYEALGNRGMDFQEDPTREEPTREEAEGGDGAEEGTGVEGLGGLATALSLLLGAWALRPLVGGPLTPPLGLGDGVERGVYVGASAGAETDLGAAIQRQTQAVFGVKEGMKAEAELRAELRAALATVPRLEPLVEGKPVEEFDRQLRLEVRALLRAGDGTFAANLLGRWGQAHRQAAAEWLAREAPSACDMADATRATSGFGNQLLQTANITSAGLAGFVALPAAAISLLLLPADIGASASGAAVKAAVAQVLQVVVGTAMLEVERRGLASARRILEDEVRPWQVRWRTAYALMRFGRILMEEGTLEVPDLESICDADYSEAVGAAAEEPSGTGTPEAVRATEAVDA